MNRGLRTSSTTMAAGATLAFALVGLAACGDDPPSASGLVGRKWREKHISNGNVVSDIVIEVTSVDSSGNATCSITCHGGASASVSAGGASGSASTGSAGSITVPAGTTSGTVTASSDPPGLAPTGPKTISTFDSFE